MEKTDYQRQLAHPKWQKLRLKIYERDNFTCQKCRSTENELQVHHIYYLPKIRAYEYPMEALATLCYKCHKDEEDRIAIITQTIIPRIRRLNTKALGMEQLIDVLEDLKGKLSVHQLGLFLKDYLKLTKEQRIEVQEFIYNNARKNG